MRSFSIAALIFSLLLIYACSKNEPGSRKPMDEEILFSKLEAERTSLKTNESTIITATVDNPCNKLTYEWTVSNGTMNGRGEEINFTAPSGKGTVTITCTAHHSGKVSKTRSVVE